MTVAPFLRMVNVAFIAFADEVGVIRTPALPPTG
jgi:hypothetical protein